MWQLCPPFRGGLLHLPLLRLFRLQLRERKEGGLFRRAKAPLGKRDPLAVPPFHLTRGRNGLRKGSQSHLEGG